MNTLSVSAIITTHKREPAILQRAIDSVLNQTYKNLEIIVVNDCPEYDKHEDISTLISSYNKEIIYLVNDFNIGANASRNKGVQISSNEIIAFLDDDDEWLPNKVEESLKYFSPAVGLVYTDMIMVEKGKERIFKKKNFEENEVFQQILSNNYVGGFSGVMFKKNIFSECGELDVDLPSYQDLDLWIRMASKCHFYHLQKPLIKYYVMEDSISLNIEKKIKGTTSLLSKYEIQYDKFPKSRHRRINSEVTFYLKNGWFKQAFTFYNKEYSQNHLLFLKNIPYLFLGITKYIVFKLIQINRLIGRTKK